MKSPRRIALLFLPVSLAATGFLLWRERRPADPFGLLAGPRIRFARIGGSIAAVTIPTSDPRARAVVAAIGDASPILAGGSALASGESPVRIGGGGREIGLDPARGEASDLARNRRYRVADPEGLRRALDALSPELIPPATVRPKD